MDFATMMGLEPHGPDTYVGVGPRYPWPGVYGGQIVAQALRAAGSTVDPTRRVHSLHAYFIRRGDPDEPIRFEVDRVRNGRSFLTRRVVARQSSGAILALEASFQVDEEGPTVQTAVMPAVPPPDDLATDSWTDVFSRRIVGEPGADGRVTAWLRMAEPVGDTALLHACALAYVSDDLPTDPVVGLHPEHGPLREAQPFMTASLDHAMWFHRAVDAGEWHLFDVTSHGLVSSRGLSVGHVFTAAGVHVATVAQEVLIRRARRDAG